MDFVLYCIVLINERAFVSYGGFFWWVVYFVWYPVQFKYKQPIALINKFLIYDRSLC